MNEFLVTRPEHDDTTHYLSHWSKIQVDFARGRGIKVLDLHREKANKKEVSSMLKKQDPRLVWLNGHGSASSVTGHNNEVMLIAGENESLLRSKIVYALSCKSAAILGKASVSAGAAAYIGYDDDFVFFYNPNSITHPASDKVAELFLKPSNILVNSLIKGQTVGAAYKKSQDEHMLSIKRALSSETSHTDSALVRYIWWNRKNQKCLGDTDAVFA